MIFFFTRDIDQSKEFNQLLKILYIIFNLFATIFVIGVNMWI